MSDFDTAFQRLIGNEGGYTNNPADPGGETMYGVTKTVATANGYTGAMKDLSLATAKFISKGQYWDKVGADNFSFAVAFQLYDIAYNHGVSRAIKLLQAASGASVDGILGPNTIRMAKAMDPAKLVINLLAGRLRFYTGLTTWATFGKGWANRVAGQLEYGAQDL